VAMRYLVVSDSHGHLNLLWNWLKTCRESWDAIIHAGDYYRDGEALSQQLGLPMFGAQGNNDRDARAPWETVWQDGTRRLGVIHGHQWDADHRLQGLLEWAKMRGCEVVVFGHSHVDGVFQQEGRWLINPGAIWRPRQGRPPLVMTLEIPKVVWRLHPLN